MLGIEITNPDDGHKAEAHHHNEDYIEHDLF